MSMGSQALERSALESKDRDSLLQIASAMGGKPGSRAKKADIIELILQLAGVTEGGDAEASIAETGADAPAATDAAPESAGDNPRSGRGGRGRGRGGDADGGAASDEADSAADQGDQAAGRNRRPADDGGRNRRDERNDRSDRNDQGRDGAGNANSTSAANSNAGAGSDDDADGRGRSGGGGDQGDQGGDQGDGEGGNRRRRRRGRDRGRDGAPGGNGGDDQFQGEPVEVLGLLDLRDEGYGFLRVSGFLPSKEDVYVSVKQVRQFGLRKGDQLKGAARPASRNEKNPALLRIDEVNGKDPEESRQRTRFEDLTAVFPIEPLRLAGDGDDAVAARVVELLAPIGKGQRGLIAAPPRSGKTTVLTQLAQGIAANNEGVHLMVLLIDERPEEVTEVRRAVEADVIASTFDRPADEHTMVAELTLERAKRLVEDGEDVVVILDGLTRLARAYNLANPGTGRTMSGGVDTGALYPPKRFFGAARNVEDGGSLTILATAVVDSGSRLDEVVHEAFEGTANMELRLDRRLAERRMFPAIDVTQTSTRHDERLGDDAATGERRELQRTLAEKAAEGGPAAALEAVLERLSR